MFFAYLRSLSPDSVQGTNGISALPLSLQNLVQATEYPPDHPKLSAISKVVMIVDSVSPTPFALLRRAKHFEYRDDDQALKEFSNYEDPVQALTDECRRVLKSISSTNQSAVSNSKTSTSLRDASWSRFEDIGFGGLGDDSDNEDPSALGKKRNGLHGLRSAPQSGTHDLGRPTTPSWADFLSAGFVDEPGKDQPALLSLPPDKMLPPIDTRRGQSSQSHRRPQDGDVDLEPGELASINLVHFDDAFWWVWISSLAGEEPTERKGVFGRCALIETDIRGGRWLVLEEMVKGAAPEPEVGAYIAEKKSRFGFSRKGRLTRTKTMSKTPSPAPKSEAYPRDNQHAPMSKTNIGPDQHARIQAAAAALQQKHRDRNSTDQKRGRTGDTVSTKTNSVFTLQPVIMSEAAPAMKWANSYDKNTVRAAYLGNDFMGKGQPTNFGANGLSNISSTNGSVTPVARKEPLRKPDSYGFPSQDITDKENLPPVPDKAEPPLPPEPPKEDIPSRPAQHTSVPPAPLPAVPFKDLHPANRAVVEASQVPLPAVTPWEQPRPTEVPLPAGTPSEQPRPSGEPSTDHAELPPRTDSKPLPPIKLVQVDTEPIPALSREPTQQPNGVSSTASSPEAKKAGKRLKKSQTGGFKGFFGRNKPTTVAPVEPRPADSTAIAAARAAYEGPQMKPNYVAPQAPRLARRLSGMGRKKAPSPIPIETSPSTQGFHGPLARSSEPSPLEPPRQNYSNYGSQASLSRVDSHEQRHADREFQTFDQGPMLDQPAFVPEDDIEGRSGSATPRQYESEPIQTQYESEPVQQPHEPEPIPREYQQPYEPQPFQREYQHDDISEVSEEERATTPPQDRWAQIRKNAAARAAKQHEEQEKPDETEEETSGEESESSPLHALGYTELHPAIESRVARIKARVAELTGNMDGARA